VVAEVPPVVACSAPVKVALSHPTPAKRVAAAAAQAAVQALVVVQVPVAHLQLIPTTCLTMV